MENNLLTALRKYRPREGKDPLENFTTEAYGWILKNYPEYSNFFLSKLSAQLNFIDKISNPIWNTQVNFNGFFPDMVCKFENKAFVFENKAWSPLHENQLENYRSYAKENFDNHKLILITANTSQHSQNPDLAICWSNIHTWITEWLNVIDKRSTSDLFIFKSFLNLLEDEGMGPAAPLSHESILYYYHSKNFLQNTRDLTVRVFNKNEIIFKELINSEEFKYIHRDDWGRIGIEFFDPWRPGIFIGIMAEWEAHATKPILGKNSPDFTIILSFDEDLHYKYQANTDYIGLVEHLKIEINSLNTGWELYNHLKDDSVEEKNIWHPIHIRKPMLDVFRGTTNTDEQEKAYMNCANEILPLITKANNFVNLRKQWKK